MTREAEAMVLLVIATIVGRLTFEGGYQSYVKSGLFWPLVLSVVVLAAVGVLTWWGDRRLADGAGVHGIDGAHHPDVHGADHPGQDQAPALAVHVHDGSGTAAHGHDGHDAHGHEGHGHSGRVGLLLLVPVAVLALIAPAPLGAFAADRGVANQVSEPVLALPELPAPVNGATDLSLGQLLLRAYWEDGEGIVDVPVRLQGFVVPVEGGAPGEFLLTRFAVACCAADGQVRQVLVAGVPAVPATDQWVEVVATWGGELRDDRFPVLDVQSLAPIPEPAQPYEY